MQKKINSEGIEWKEDFPIKKPLNQIETYVKKDGKFMKIKKICEFGWEGVTDNG